MNINSSDKLRITIEKAIEDNELTRAEYDEIIQIAEEDGIIDNQERALLSQLQDMIENKEVRLVP